MEDLRAWFVELRQPLDVPDFEPSIDDKDKAKDKELRCPTIPFSNSDALSMQCLWLMM